MKKIFSILCIVIFSLSSLFAGWYKVSIVDEFGDKTGEYAFCMKTGDTSYSQYSWDYDKNCDVVYYATEKMILFDPGVSKSTVYKFLARVKLSSGEIKNYTATQLSSGEFYLTEQQTKEFLDDCTKVGSKTVLELYWYNNDVEFRWTLGTLDDCRKLT